MVSLQAEKSHHCARHTLKMLVYLLLLFGAAYRVAMPRL